MTSRNPGALGVGADPRRRLLVAGAATYDEHLRRYGPLPTPDAAALHTLVHDSGLSGRGGAGFPSARKLATVAAASGRAVVVANGAEGEPASSKDRVLLAHAPHLVLDGLMLAAHAVGASTGYLYAARDVLDGPLRMALEQRHDRPAVRTVAAPDTFVAGQESAAVAAINGGPAIPTSPRPPVYQRGVAGRPTLVLNVETLAHLALVARHGPAWFRTVGTPEEPGTRLVTISGAVAAPGVYEVAGGIALGQLLAAAGGAAEPVQAVLVGGYHGGWVPWNEHTATTGHTREALRRYEAAPGAGVVVALPSARCGVRAGAEIAAYLAGQSAAQCGPCRNGLPAVAGLFARLAAGHAGPQTVSEIERIVGLTERRGACTHPDGTARFVRSTLRAFGGEVRLHLAGRCTSGPLDAPELVGGIGGRTR